MVARHTQPNPDLMIKKLYHIGLIAYLALFILSIVFYKERIVFVDCAYQLFQILRTSDFTIQNYRYGAIVTQIYPLLCAKLSVPLNASIYVYSASFIIHFATCYWISGRVLKQYGIALSILLFNILFVTDTFYWAQSELPQGAVFLLLTLAVMRSEIFIHKPILQALLLVPMIVLSTLFHPILFIAAIFLAGYFAINNKIITNKKIFFIAAAALLITFYLKLRFVVTAYDTKAMKTTDNIFSKIADWPNLYSTRHFIKHMLGRFMWIPVCSAIIGIIYIKERKWLNLLLFTAFMVGYTIIINTSYPTDYTKDFYIENLYLPLSIFIAIPFVFDVLPRLEQKQLGYILFVLILATGLVRIYLNHDTYTNRLTWERNLLKNNPGKKMLIAETPAIADTLIMAWGTPYEFWLLSTTESAGKETANIFVTDTLDKFYLAHWDRKSFITNWQVIDYSALPEKYFNLNDTFSRYEIVR